VFHHHKISNKKEKLTRGLKCQNTADARPVAEKQAGECFAALILRYTNVAIKDMFFVMIVKMEIGVRFVLRITFSGILIRRLKKSNPIIN